MLEREEEAVKIKILLIGDSQAGKSSIVANFTGIAPNEERKGMITIIPAKVDNVSYEFVEMPFDPTRLKGGTLPKGPYDSVIIVADLSEPGSINDVRNWKDEVERMRDTGRIKGQFGIVVMGNKVDKLDEERKDSAQSWGIDYQVSATTGEGIKEAFKEISQDIKLVKDFKKADEQKEKAERQNVQEVNRHYETDMEGKLKLLKQAKQFSDLSWVRRSKILVAKSLTKSPPEHIEALRDVFKKLGAIDSLKIDLEDVSTIAKINKAYNDCAEIFKSAAGKHKKTRNKELGSEYLHYHSLFSGASADHGDKPKQEDRKNSKRFGK